MSLKKEVFHGHDYCSKKLYLTVFSSFLLVSNGPKNLDLYLGLLYAMEDLAV